MRGAKEDAPKIDLGSFSSEILGVIFAGLALVMNEPRIALDEQEGKLLGERLGKVLDARSQNKKLRKALDKHAPMLLFVLALVAVLAPRWPYFTGATKRADSIPQNNPGAGSAPTTGSEPVTGGVRAHGATGDGNGSGPAHRSNGANPRPFRRADYQELFGSDE